MVEVIFISMKSNLFKHMRLVARNLNIAPQAYHPLLVWWAVHLKWLCRFIKLAKLKPKFRSFKTEENEIKSHKIAAMVF